MNRIALASGHKRPGIQLRNPAPIASRAQQVAICGRDNRNKWASALSGTRGCAKQPLPALWANNAIGIELVTSLKYTHSRCGICAIYAISRTKLGIAKRQQSALRRPHVITL